MRNWATTFNWSHINRVHFPTRLVPSHFRPKLLSTQHFRFWPWTSGSKTLKIIASWLSSVLTADNLSHDLGGQAVHFRTAINADPLRAESRPPPPMGDRSGAQEIPRDLGCDLCGMGCGIQPPAPYDGGEWTQLVLGNARRTQAKILYTTSAWLISQFVLILWWFINLAIFRISLCTGWPPG